MKKFLAIVAIVAFAIFAITDTVHDFVANNTIGYFAEQPHRLFLVAIIGIVGGIAALIFDKLSSKTKRGVKLFVVGSAASCLTFFAGYFLFQFTDISAEIKANIGSTLIFIPIGFSLVAAVLWFEFYQIFKKKA